MAPWKQTPSRSRRRWRAAHSRSPLPFFFSLSSPPSLARSLPLSFPHSRRSQCDLSRRVACRHTSASRPRGVPRVQRNSFRDESVSCSLTTSHSSQTSDSWRPFSVQGYAYEMREEARPPSFPSPTPARCADARAIRAMSRGTGRRALIGRRGRYAAIFATFLWSTSLLSAENLKFIIRALDSIFQMP